MLSGITLKGSEGGGSYTEILNRNSVEAYSASGVPELGWPFHWGKRAGAFCLLACPWMGLHQKKHKLKVDLLTRSKFRKIVSNELTTAYPQQLGARPQPVHSIISVTFSKLPCGIVERNRKANAIRISKNFFF